MSRITAVFILQYFNIDIVCHESLLFYITIFQYRHSMSRITAVFILQYFNIGIVCHELLLFLYYSISI